MTVVLRPSEIENRDFLPPEQFSLFVDDVRDATKQSVDHLLFIGGGFSIGSDIDIVCFFNERTTSEILRCQRAIEDVCRAYKMRYFDTIRLCREKDGHVLGIGANHGIGPLLHMQSQLEDQPEEGGDTFKKAIDAEVERRMAASADPFRDEIVEYASHKASSLVEHASHPFDLEDRHCTDGLGKILSFAGHAGRQLMRYEMREEPCGGKREMLQWAEKRPLDPHANELAALLQEDFFFREMLESYVDDSSLAGRYASDLRYVRDRLSVRVIDFARRLRADFAKR